MTTPYLDRILECKDDDNIVLLRDKGNAETIISARHFKREIEALIADRETLVAKLNSIAYRSSLPDSYEEGFDEAIGAAIKIVSGDENLNLWKREDEDTRYAAAQREIEELRQFVTEIGYVEFGDDLIARRNHADGLFVLFEEDNPAYSVTGSDAFEVWKKWKQEDV